MQYSVVRLCPVRRSRCRAMSFNSAALANYHPWTTGSSDLDRWVEGILDRSVQDQLATFDQKTRLKLMTSLKIRCETGNVHKPNGYALSMFKAEKRPQPYAAKKAPMAKNGDVMPPVKAKAGVPPAGESPRSSSSQPVPPSTDASVLVQAASSSPPAWIKAGWEHKNNRTAMMREVASSLPADALTALNSMPGQLQVMAVHALLVTAEHHNDPKSFFDRVYATARLLDGAGVPPTPAGSQKQKVAVIHIGYTWGVELVALNMIQQELLAANLAVEVSAVFCVSRRPQHESVLSQIVTFARNVHPVELYTFEQDHPHLVRWAEFWKEAGAVFVVSICTPTAQPAWSNPNASSVGLPSVDEFEYCTQVVKSIDHIIPEALCAIVVPDNACGPGGSAWQCGLTSRTRATSSMIRVPTKGWDVFTAIPSADVEAKLRRQVSQENFPEVVHDDLRRIAVVNSPYFPCLPTLATIEARLEAIEESMEVLADDDTTLKLVLQATGPAKGQLLSMDVMRQVCGLGGWSFAEEWTVQKPCMGMVSAFTGLVVEASSPEAVPRGTARWCPHCAEQYAHMAEAPSLYLWQGIYSALIHKFVQKSEGEDGGLFKIANI